MYQKHTGFLFALHCILAGCALVSTSEIIPNPAAQQAFAARQAALGTWTQWQISGRIGVVQEGEGWHASFQWQQQNQYDRIDLLGPLGQGRVLLEGAPEQVRVTAQNGQQWSAPDADTALSQGLGVQLPMNGLRYWIRGLPTPNVPYSVALDELGRPTRLEQSGWVLEYADYASDPQAALKLSEQLPRRLTARRDALTVKLVITQWEHVHHSAGSRNPVSWAQ